MKGVGSRRAALRGHHNEPVFRFVFFFFYVKASLYWLVYAYIRTYIYKYNINHTICTESKLEDVHGKQCRSDGLHKTSLLMKLAYCANSHINGAL